MKNSLVLLKDKKELDVAVRGTFTETEKKSFGIFLNGKRVKLANGKSVWASIGAAKNALHNHLYYCYRDYGEEAVKEWVKHNITILFS